MSRFTDCLPLLLAHEGGYVDDPRDPGGATNLGVTLATLSAWRDRPCTKADVQALTPEMVGPIYLANYWRPCGCNQLPAGVDYMVFDMAVNSGPARARRAVQEAAGVFPDGDLGPKSMAAIAACGALKLINAMSVNREAYYRALPTFSTFGRGWLNRLNDVTAQAKAFAFQLSENP